MKNRFIYLFLFFMVAALWATLAKSAEEYATPRFYTQWLTARYFDTQEAACSAGAARAVENSGTLQSALVSYAVGGRNQLGVCYIKYTPFNQAGTGTLNGSLAALQSCPAGYTLGPSTTNLYQRLCTIANCPAGTTLNATTNKCDDNCLPNKGKTDSFGLNCSAETNTGRAVCMPNNCVATIVDSSSAYVSGCWYGVNTARYTGVTCSGQPSSFSFSNPSNANPAPADSPETDCIKKGMSFGTVNGAVACVSKTTEGAAPVKDSSETTNTTKNTDSSGNETTSSAIETKTTTKDGEQVTTTTTLNNPDGTKKEETKTQSYDDFCAQNPANKLCKSDSDKESKFEGDCLSNFVCEGDSVQCAMALKQHKTYCENTESNTYSDIFNTQKSAADALTANGGSVLPSSVVNIPTTIQGQKLLSAGGISDMSFPIMGQAIILPFSKLNPALEFAGQMVLIISYLISAYILFGHKGAQ